MTCAPMQRWLVAPVFGLLAVLLLFGFLHWAITPRELRAVNEGPPNEGIELVQVRPEPERPEPPPQELPQNAPPPPPDAPPSLARPELSAAPALANVPLDAGPVTVNVGAIAGAATGIGGLGSLGTGLGAGFGGFAGGGGGGGGGSGGKGFATGKSFEGKTLIPLSTARPQMPDWACKQKIKGWVEVVFTVMPNGRVQDVKIVDASPRGVYEAAAIESVSNWIYAPYKNAREVKQRVPMNPEDCEFNYPQ